MNLTLNLNLIYTYNCLIECTVEGDFIPCSDVHPRRGVSSGCNVDENVSDDSVHINEKILILAETQYLAVRQCSAISCIHVTPIRSDQPSAVSEREWGTVCIGKQLPGMKSRHCCLPELTEQ